jgi:hypothetical protein
MNVRATPFVPEAQPLKDGKHFLGPTTEYLGISSEPVQFLKSLDHKLVILDLNGTLVYRPDGARTTTQPRLRPGLQKFTRYLLANFAVMIWSSSTPRSVETMCQVVFTPAQRQQLVACWARDTLRLSQQDYNRKVQTVKNLQWIWQAEHLPSLQRFSQRNTIMIDDSRLKLLQHPHNMIEVPEYTKALMDSGKDNVLGEIQNHLEKLKFCSNVSAYLSQIPIVFGQIPRKVKKPKKTKPIVDAGAQGQNSDLTAPASSEEDTIEETPVTMNINSL